MIKIIKLSFALIACAFSFSISAQTKYYTGFDSVPELANWDAYVKGKTGSAVWQIENGGISDPSKLDHVAPTGDANKDSLVNWYVSPKFDFSEGGSIDSLSTTTTPI